MAHVSEAHDSEQEEPIVTCADYRRCRSSHGFQHLLNPYSLYCIRSQKSEPLLNNVTDMSRRDVGTGFRSIFGCPVPDA